MRHVMTTAYHPQANILVARAHRQIKDALRAHRANTDWPSHLPWILLGLHAAPKEIGGFSSAEAAFGQQLMLRGSCLWSGGLSAGLRGAGLFGSTSNQSASHLC
jgi:hypothetical protein